MKVISWDSSLIDVFSQLFRGWDDEDWTVTILNAKTEVFERWEIWYKNDALSYALYISLHDWPIYKSLSG